MVGLMLVEFFTNKNNEIKEVKHKTDLTPRFKTYTKYRVEIDSEGNEFKKPVINVTEGYYCYMKGPQALEIALGIGLNRNFHRQGMWILSKSKYKQAQRFISSPGYRDKVIPTESYLKYVQKCKKKLKK